MSIFSSRIPEKIWFGIIMNEYSARQCTVFSCYLKGTFSNIFRMNWIKYYPYIIKRLGRLCLCIVRRTYYNFSITISQYLKSICKMIRYLPHKKLYLALTCSGCVLLKIFRRTYKCIHWHITHFSVIFRRNN